MELLKNWTVTVCGAAVLCTLLSRLFPDTGVGRQGRMLLPCVFLLAVLVPLSRSAVTLEWPDFTTQELSSSDLETRLQQQTVAQLNAGLLAMSNQALHNYGYEAKKVVTDVDISADGCIDMGQITVYVDEDTARHRGEVVQIVEQRLGTPIHLAVWEDTP